MRICQHDAVMYGVLMVRRDDRRLTTVWEYSHEYDLENPDMLGDPEFFEPEDDEVFSSRKVGR